ncbi:DUF1127 domain-containing protein [Chelativorans xinjiangense]|uniref:DUF1127 domain-containing protein n=1 Tax=Chelativorans xinjiangense TaxID=2681485 RepID=UPI001358044E|nr:DUF1127 domain-containing protein [Chelativorans xinjiangense]
MTGFHWSRRASTQCPLNALSDHQLKDIGLSRSGMRDALVPETVGQFAVIQPPANRRRRWLALVSFSMLSIALGLWRGFHVRS